MSRILPFNIVPGDEPSGDGRAAGCYHRHVKSVEEARETAKALVQKHYPPPSDPLDWWMPLDYHALISIDSMVFQLGDRVVYMGCLEVLWKEVRVYTVTSLGGLGVTLGDPSELLFGTKEN